MWDCPHAENWDRRDKERAQWLRSGGTGGRLSCAACRAGDRMEVIPTELAVSKASVWETNGSEDELKYVC